MSKVPHVPQHIIIQLAAIPKPTPSQPPAKCVLGRPGLKDPTKTANIATRLFKHAPT